MRIFNEDKTKELSVDECKNGYFTHDVIIKHHEEIKAVEEKSHLVKYQPPLYTKVIDREAVEGVPAYDEEEEVLIYHEDTEEEKIRLRRAYECFPVINRGKFFYESLTPEETDELRRWYYAWLDAPDTKEIPEKPQWLDGKIKQNTEVIV